MITHSGRARAAISAKSKKTADDCDYADLIGSVHVAFGFATTMGEELFKTDAEGLWNAYLKNLPARQRQTHNCHCCRRFIETYGALVTIDEDGRTTPAMWCLTAPGIRPTIYDASFTALYRVVNDARVTSPFLTKETQWGVPSSEGGWTHPFVTPPSRLVYRERLLTPGQAMAAAKENFRNVAAALGEFKASALDDAIRILEAEALSQSQKFVAPVRWLRELQKRPRGKFGENILWRAVASAPEGFCHPRASMVGTLLEDIRDGLSFAEVKKRFDAKMAPLRYQRPTVAPTAGNIAAAEKVIDKLGIERSLERRFAQLDEIETIWTPREPSVRLSGGVFGHLKAKQDASSSPMTLPRQMMTWEKFSRAILPGAEKMEVWIEHGAGPFLAMTTAVNADAPPILKWDREERRNSVAWYVYPGGSAPQNWGLSTQWNKVNAVTRLPCEWGDKPMSHISSGVVLIIDKMRDQRDPGNALFPECLRDDLHGVRSTIEAYSRTAKLKGAAKASACGYDLRKTQARARLRVFSSGAWQEYSIDRWD